MYLKPLCLTVLISLCCTALAKKQPIADKLQVVAVDIKQQGDSINLNILFQLTTDITSTESIELTPFLTRSEKTGIFPSLILNGKQRQKVQKRDYSFMSIEERKKALQSGTKVLEVTAAPFIYTYYGKLGYEDWMRSAALNLSIFGCRCGKTEISSLSHKNGDNSISKVSEQDKKKTNSAKADKGSINIRLQSKINLPGPYDDIIPLLQVSEFKPYISERDRQEIKYEIQFDYEPSKTKVNEKYRNNKGSIAELKQRIEELINNGAFIKHIHISGYASPEGTFEQNMEISKKRSIAFSEQLKMSFGFTDNQLIIDWHGEDWDGLKKLLQSYVTNYQNDALRIIETTGIFQGREKRLMDLHSGNAYRHMSEVYFPLLRRVEFRINYSNAENDPDKIRELFKKNNQKLTLNDFNLLLNQEKFGSSGYRSILSKIVERYPNDETAILNTAAICLIDHKPDEAWKYLKRKYSKKRIYEYENNLAIYYLTIGKGKQAIQLMENAAKAGCETSNQNLKYIIN